MEKYLEKGRINFYIITSLVIIAGFILSSLYSYNNAKKSLEEQLIKTVLPLTSELVIDNLTHDLKEPILLSSAMAKNTLIYNFLQNNEQNVSMIESYLKKHLEFENVVTSFFISEKSKRYYHPSGKERFIQEDEQWYFDTKSSSHEYELVVSEDENNKNDITYFINHRVTSDDGTFLGVIGLGIKLNTIQKMIKAYEDKFNKMIYIIDKEGNRKFSNKVTNIKDKNEVFRKHFHQILSNKVFSIEHAHSVLGKCNLTFQSEHIEALNWYVVVSEPHCIFNQYLDESLYVNLLIVFFVTFMVLFISYMSFKTYQHKRYSIIASALMYSSHQWKQPISIISAYVLKMHNALYRDKEIKLIEFKEDIKRIEQKLSFTNQTMDSLKELFSNAEKSKEDFDLHLTLMHIKANLKILFDEHRINFQIKSKPNTLLYGNQILLENALYNIVYNAYEAFIESDQQSPTLDIEVTRKENSIVLFITDNAGGIQVEPIESIFDVFISVKKSGSGLGLPLSKKVIEEEFNGTIGVKNLKNSTQFKIVLMLPN